mgnify:CR=1 FL=1
MCPACNLLIIHAQVCTCVLPAFKYARGRALIYTNAGCQLNDPICYSPGPITHSLSGTNFVGVGGIALLGSFGDGSTGTPNTVNNVAPVFIFSSNAGTQAVWEAVSHELGHALGLS